MKTLARPKSEEIFEKSKGVILGGVNSPVRAFIGLNTPPLIAKKGAGDTIWDADGKPYIDYCMSWGAMLHGHAPKEVILKTTKRMQEGTSFGIATEEEYDLAKAVKDAVPSMEKLRFVSSGTEATMTAIRVARGFTGRPLIIKFNGNYHGHAGPFLVKAGSGVSQVSQTSSSKGVPEDIVKHTISLPYNHTEKVKQLFRDPFYGPQIAAVIVEPVAANMGVVPASKDFLQVLRDETEKMGAILIFDEVISGFRIEYGGVQKSIEIIPDMTCLGKIVGGGFPAAAFGGKEEIMDVLAPKGEVYQAGTLSGNSVAMVAGLETLLGAKEPGFYDELQEKVRLITEPVRSAIEEKRLDACIQDIGGMFTLFWGPKKVTCFEDLEALDHERFGNFFRFLLERGVYFSPSPYEACFVSSAHTKTNLLKTRDLILEFIADV